MAGTVAGSVRADYQTDDQWTVENRIESRLESIGRTHRGLKEHRIQSAESGLIENWSLHPTGRRHHTSDHHLNNSTLL